jgi:pimeloyl-ACP methyl ester carboxylesterase
MVHHPFFGGFDAGGLSFRKTIPVLTGRHRVFAPDWPGFGQSAAMPRNWCVEECVDFIADLLDALGLKRAILIGLSMGGAFALSGSRSTRPNVWSDWC